MSQRRSLRLLQHGTTVANAPKRSNNTVLAMSPRAGRGPLRLHVTLGFLIGAALPGLPHGWRGMFLWGPIVFVSLIVHELGHAATGLVWGSRATIVMYPLGGATHMDPPLSTGRTIIAYLAGPLVSLTVGLAAAWLRVRFGHPAWLTVVMWVNLGWAGLNLLPVPPFDGGYVLLKAMGPARATSALAIAASIAAGVSMTGFVVVRSAALSAVFGGVAAYSMVEWARRKREEVEARLGLPVRLQNAEALLTQGRPAEAQELAATVVKAARSKRTRRTASELLAWCHLRQDRPERAREALIAAAPLPALDAYCRAAVEEACGHEEIAIEILERARHREGLRPEAVKRLVDLHARRGRFDLVCRVTADEIRGLDPDDARRVIDAAVEAGAFTGAAELAGALFDSLSKPDDGIAQAYSLAKGGEARRAVEVLHRVSALTDGMMGEGAHRLLSELAHERHYANVVQPLLARAARRSTA
jgi:Zn-dependent protease